MSRTHLGPWGEGESKGRWEYGKGLPENPAATHPTASCALRSWPPAGEASNSVSYWVNAFARLGGFPVMVRSLQPPRDFAPRNT